MSLLVAEAGLEHATSRYEPGELPTAPLRDINHRNQINNRSISELRVQRYDFLLKPPNVFAIIFSKMMQKG